MAELAQLDWLRPDWPAPPSVHALSTTRNGGFSGAPYSSMNLGLHVGDDPDAVGRNRARLEELAQLRESPRWLSQVHGTRVVHAATVEGEVAADASITDAPGVVCAVLTADCLPVLLCHRDGSVVAAVHGGWRGLCGGVIEAVVAAFGDMGIDPGALMAWLGPAISAPAYEVGDDVRQALASQGAEVIRPNEAGRWQLDLSALARTLLRRAGVMTVGGGGWCTFDQAERFYSYRRDGVCGRQATLIWRSGVE